MSQLLQLLAPLRSASAMPWWLLALGALSLLQTLNGLFPEKGKHFAQVPRFFSAWLVIELVLHQLVGQGLFAGYLVSKGGLATGVGKLGLALLVISGVGMLQMWLAARKAGPIMRNVVGKLAGDGRWPSFPLDKILLPFFMVRFGAKKTRNVVFGRAGGKLQKLDIVEPKTRSQARRPAILQIHGGGWVIGDKREQGLPLLNHLACHGWVGFNANYRKSPAATFPEHLIDMKRALAWIREHADEYHINPNFIIVTGGSAGGHLTSLMALTANDPHYQPGFEDADTSVQGAVPFYAVYDFCDRLEIMPKEFFSMLLEPWVMKKFRADEPDAFRAASPIEQIRPDAPPFLIIHGDKDTLAPVEYARLFAKELRAVSQNSVLYAELPGAEHAFDVFTSPRTVRVLAGVERFVHGLHQAHINGAEQPARQASVDTRAAKASKASPKAQAAVANVANPA